MARYARYPRPFRAGRARRLTAWGVGPDGVSQQLTSSGSLLFTNGASPASEPVTIVRTRGSLLFYLSASVTGGDGYHGAVGIGIVEANAFNAGIASMPTPITEEDWDGWMWHQYFHLLAPTPIAGGASQDGDAMLTVGAILRQEIDSKAMRKIHAEEVLFAAVEATEIGSATIVCALRTRILVKQT